MAAIRASARAIFGSPGEGAGSSLSGTGGAGGRGGVGIASRPLVGKGDPGAFGLAAASVTTTFTSGTDGPSRGVVGAFGLDEASSTPGSAIRLTEGSRGVTADMRLSGDESSKPSAPFNRIPLAGESLRTPVTLTVG